MKNAPVFTGKSVLVFQIEKVLILCSLFFFFGKYINSSLLFSYTLSNQLIYFHYIFPHKSFVF